MADNGQRSSRKRCMCFLGLFVAAAVVAVTLGLALHFTLGDDEDGGEGAEKAKTGEGGEEARRSGVIVDCYPELRRDASKMAANKEACEARGCTWQRLQEDGAPWCTFPPNYGYSINGSITETDNSYSVKLTRNTAPAMFKMKMFDRVTLRVELQTANRVRVRIYPDTPEPRWEVPNSILNIEATNSHVTKEDCLYNVTFTEKPFGVIITRKSTGVHVFNSSVPGLLLADQYLQLTTRVTSERVFGFGEHRHSSFQHDMKWKLWSMFTRDSGPNTDWNLYGQHPVYMNVEPDTRANMVLLKNSNAMEVLLQPSPEPAITYRVIGGVLDFYIFLGDSPSDVVRHYIEAIGQPVFPPYWSMGFHLCRWGYKDIDDWRDTNLRNKDAGIPFDAQWADVDTFHKAYVFTYSKKLWPGFPELIDELLIKNKRHFITLVDPGIGCNQTIIDEIQRDFPTYNMITSGEELGIFIKTANNTNLVGEVWPGVTVYPDFTNNKTQAWWTKWIKYYRDELKVKVDALWIDMNEPSNFVKGSTTGCNNNSWNYPPYLPHLDGVEEKGELFVKTLCMDSVQALGAHYDVHSLYAHTMAMQTYSTLQDVFPGKRPWTMTRASFVGTGHYATKWQGDNQALWSHMHYSIISLFEFGLFGFPMNGADICGFWLEPSYELCVRWHQLGAFYPFARNHNGKGDDPVLFKPQDPASWGADFVNLVKPVLLTRYKFLPYLYTQLYRAHVDRELVFKPLLFEFTKDNETFGIDKQFMLGPAFLISPVLEENATSVHAYFPQGRWFDYSNGHEISSDGKYVTLDTPLHKFNLHIRGGFIVPWQVPGVTTEDSRQNDLGLLIALNHVSVAHGELFWDDGVSTVNDSNYNLINFTMSQAGELTINPVVISPLNVGGTLAFKTIEIYGLSRPPSDVSVNGQPLPSSSVKFYNQIVQLVDLPDLNMTSVTNVTWSVY